MSDTKSDATDVPAYKKAAAPHPSNGTKEQRPVYMHAQLVHAGRKYFPGDVESTPTVWLYNLAQKGGIHAGKLVAEFEDVVKRRAQAAAAVGLEAGQPGTPAPPMEPATADVSPVVTEYRAGSPIATPKAGK